MTDDPRLPPELQEALRTRTPEDAAILTREFLEANAEDRAGMLAFIRGNGPERCRQLRLEHEEGIPAAYKLEGWLSI